MAGYIPNEGEIAALNAKLKDANPEALILRLYSNNYDAVAASTASNFTECSGAGYAAKNLTRAGWGSAIDDGGGKAQATYGTGQAFSFTGAITVVGYILVGATSGKVWFAERLYAGTGQAFAAGDSLTVTPRMTHCTE